MRRLPVLFLVLALLCYASVWVSPGWFWPAAFFSLAIPGMLVVSLVWAVVALLRQRGWRTFVLPGLAALAGLPFLWLWLTPRVVAPDPAPGGGLKVLSWNVASLGGKRWRHNSRQQNALSQYRAIDSIDADVCLLQEFYHNPAVPAFMGANYLRKQGYNYRFLSTHQPSDGITGYSVAIFSRFPLTKGRTLDRRPTDNNQIILADVAWAGRKLRLIDLHFASIKLTWDEQSYQHGPMRLFENFISIFGKLKKAYQLRAKQVAIATQAIEESPYPVILAGDFNDTLFSYSYFRIRRLLQNSHEAAGRGLGVTFSGRIPLLRIDHQFASDTLQRWGYMNHTEIDLSDHRPQSCYYR